MQWRGSPSDSSASVAPFVLEYRQGLELVERETRIQELLGHLLDPVQLGFQVRGVGVFPGPGALEADLVGVQELPQPFPADAHRMCRCPLWVGAGVAAAQVGSEFADAPVGEGQPEPVGPGLGRRVDDHGVSVGDSTGSTARPVRVQAGQPLDVEPVVHRQVGRLRRRHPETRWLEPVTDDQYAGPRTNDR
jgi:hypothetical protein